MPGVLLMSVLTLGGGWQVGADEALDVRSADALVHFEAGQQVLVLRFAVAVRARRLLLVVPVPPGAKGVPVADDLFEATAAVVDPPPVDIDLQPQRLQPRHATATASPPPRSGRVGPHTVTVLADAELLAQWLAARGVEGAPEAPAGWGFLVIQVDPVVADRAVEGFVGPVGLAFATEAPLVPHLPLPTGSPLTLLVIAPTPLGLADGPPLVRQVPASAFLAPGLRPVRIFGGRLAQVEPDQLLTALDERAIPAAEVPDLLRLRSGPGVLSVLHGAQPAAPLQPLVALRIDKKRNHAKGFDLVLRGPQADGDGRRITGAIATPVQP